MNKKRLMLLVRRLESKSVNKKNFDMQDWFADKEGKEDCGTVCCAFGHACFIPSFKKSGLTRYIRTPSYEGQFGFSAAEAFFDIEEKEAYHLFSSNDYGYKRPVTPKDVARRIRRLVTNHRS